jgi:predicted transcriptional regulator
MHPDAIREFAASFQKSRILLSGFELDIFSNVDEPGTTSNQIAEKLNLDDHACDRLLNALVSLGFLTKYKHKQAITQQMTYRGDSI